jgi:transcriptional regulator with GAF, ATPase, and Fis domain
MSQAELTRLTLIEKVANKQLSQLEAAEQLGLSARQLRCLQRRYEQKCAAGVNCSAEAPI